MSLSPFWVEIVCRLCAETTAGRFTYGTLKRREMRNEATRQGWVLDPIVEDWFCAKCKHSPDRQELRDRG